MVVRRLLVEWIILLCCGIALAFFLARGEVTNRFDAQLLDRAAALAREPASEEIVIVAIDDASLAELGAWPWPRDLHARLLDRLAAAGSDMVLLDILFIEPTTAQADTALADAIARNGKVVLPFSFVPRPNALSGTVPEYPLPALVRAAAGLGHVAIAPDADGVLRRFDMQRESDGERYPHFVFTALQGHTHADAGAIARPVISFHPVGSYSRIGAADVIAGRVPDGFLRGKSVVVGATAQGMGDRYAVGARQVDIMPGVETQANLLDAGLHGGLVRDLPPFWSGLLAALALLVQFLAFWRLSPRAGLVATFAIALAVAGGVVLLVPLAGLWVAPGAAVLLVLLAYPFWSWRRLTSVSAYLEEEAAFLRPEGRERAQVEGFDRIARQVARMRALVSHVSEGFALMETVIEAAPDAILVRDSAGLVVMANRRAQGLFPGWREGSPEPLAELLADAVAHFDRDRGEIAFPDGRTFLVAQADFEVEKSHEGGDILALREITDTRRREEEKREMLEFLSHDMRTPQVAIIGLSKRIAKEGAQEGLADRVRLQAERTLKLADDFVQIARLEEAELALEEGDLAALVDEACDRAYAAARAKRIRFDSHLPEEPLYAPIDASLIARMIDNLLGNAIKFSPEASTIRIALQSAPTCGALLTIADEGPGLPPERHADPFARFGAHEGRAGPSVGLGLTFVKRVVDKHGGTISVHSASEGGTRFEVELPGQ